MNVPGGCGVCARGKCGLRCQKKKMVPAIITMATIVRVIFTLDFMTAMTRNYFLPTALSRAELRPDCLWQNQMPTEA